MAQEITYPSGASMQLRMYERSERAPMGGPLDLMSREIVTQWRSGAVTKTWRDVWDAATQTITQRTPTNRTLTVRYDTEGRPVSYQQGQLEPRALTYDAQGRLIRRGQGALYWEYEWLPDGDQIMRNALQESYGVSLDDMGRPSAMQWPSGRSYSYGSDDVGRLVSLTPPSGAMHAWSYDAEGNETGYIAPQSQAKSISYVDGVQIDEVTLATGEVIDYAYDAQRRVVAIRAPEGDVRFEYDGGGLPSAIAREDAGALEHALLRARTILRDRTGGEPGDWLRPLGACWAALLGWLKAHEPSKRADRDQMSEPERDQMDRWHVIAEIASVSIALWSQHAPAPTYGWWLLAAHLVKRKLWRGADAVRGARGRSSAATRCPPRPSWSSRG